MIESENDELNFIEGDNAALQIINDEGTLRFLTSDYINENNNIDEEAKEKDIKELTDANIEKLRSRYSEVLEKVKPTADPANAFNMLEKVQGGKSSDYSILTKTINSLVKEIGIHDLQDFRIEDIVLLVLDMFTALRQYIHEFNVQHIIRRRVKSAITANKQRNKDQLKFGNMEAYLSDLYKLYPEVGTLASGRWLTSAERPYKDTVLDIVEAIGIKDAHDTRISHAVTLAMDQYPVLRDQITNPNLRKQFLSRIKRSFSNKSKTKVKRSSNDEICQNEDMFDQDKCAGSKIPRIELVIEQDEENECFLDCEKL
ncbi:uncharacterized protein LOC120333244 [Styela clava]